MMATKALNDLNRGDLRSHTQQQQHKHILDGLNYWANLAYWSYIFITNLAYLKLHDYRTALFSIYFETETVATKGTGSKLS